MRKFPVVFLGFAGLVGAASTSTLYAEENKTTATEASPEAVRMVERRMEIMKEKLNLTAEQVEKIKAILLRDQEKFIQIRNDATITPEDRNTKAREILKSSTAELQALLTPEQMEKWKAEAEKQRRPAQDRQAGQDAAKSGEKK